MLMYILMTATLVAIYWFWIRPILKSRPAFQEFYEREDSLFAALCEKLKGIKQKLSSVIVIAASAAVSGYDFFVPIVSGVDVSSIASPGPVLGMAARPDRDHRAVPVPPQPGRQAPQGGVGRCDRSRPRRVAPCGLGLPA